MAVNFIGGGNQSTQRKQPTRRLKLFAYELSIMFAFYIYNNLFHIVSGCNTSYIINSIYMYITVVRIYYEGMDHTKIFIS